MSADTPATSAPTPEILTRVTPRWIVAFVLAMVGVAAGWFGPLQILLPAQAAALESAGVPKEAILAVVTGIGAAASMVANPLWGAISDRTRSRWGRRRPILVVGTVMGSLGMVILAVAPDPVWMAVGWVTVQIGLNGPFAALAAVIADRVPDAQRGLVGALFGVAQTIGVVLGTAIAVLLGEGSLGYAALALAVPALVLSFAIVHHEPPTTDTVTSSSGRPMRTFVAGLRPTAHFSWMWAIRFLMNLANALVLLYMYYYLTDGVGLVDAGEWVLIITLVNVVVTVAVASVFGPLSDRWGRRLPFVASAAIIVAAGSLLLAFFPALPVVLLAASLIGIGWGLYIAVELAIITSTLRADSTYATMLGLSNIAAPLPQVLAPVVAAPIVLLWGGYTGLYGAAAIASLLALACVPALRSRP